MKTEMICRLSATMPVASWVLACALFAACAPELHAQKIKPEEERMRKLEGKVDELTKKVDAMTVRMRDIDGNLEKINTAKQSGQPVESTGTGGVLLPSETMEAAQAQADKYQAGPMMELHLLADENALKMPAGPGLSSAVDAKTLFEGNRFLETKQFDTHRNKALGQMWAGFLRVKEKGAHVFQWDLICAEVKGTPYGYGTAAVEIEGAERASIVFEKVPVEPSITRTFSLELEPGYYKMRVWIAAPGKVKPNMLENRSAKLYVRGPSDQIPRAVTAEDFLHAK